MCTVDDYIVEIRKLWRAIFMWNFKWKFTWIFKWNFTWSWPLRASIQKFHMKYGSPGRPTSCEISSEILEISHENGTSELSYTKHVFIHTENIVMRLWCSRGIWCHKSRSYTGSSIAHIWSKINAWAVIPYVVRQSDTTLSGKESASIYKLLWWTWHYQCCFPCEGWPPLPCNLKLVMCLWCLWAVR